MAVFTPVTLEDLTEWMTQFPLGKPLALRGISSGIENSNFFLTTETGEYVLTIFEKLSFEQLPFYLHLMRHLAQRAVSVPAPIANQDGEILHKLHGKPASIVTRLQGAHQPKPQPVHCAAVGAMLAKMHLAAQDFGIRQPNLRGREWRNQTAPIVLPYLSDEGQHLLKAEIHFQEAFAASDIYHHLPNGPIHADLFRDNVMFDGERLTGFFDFYFAGCDMWLFDVAVTVNDWCIDLATGEFDVKRVRALLDAYQEMRAFTDAEKAAWQPILRAAALRFWLSRLYDFHLPRDAQMLTPHDPTHFERILKLRIGGPIPPLA
ncbi:MAG: homoserine kinase [Burkholderiales bacterium]|nr:homoserine kinase [Burkholderiales bacterium]